MKSRQKTQIQMWKFHRRINKMEEKIEEETEIEFDKGKNLTFEETIIDFRKITGVEDVK